MATKNRWMTPLFRERWEPWCLAVACTVFVALAQHQSLIEFPDTKELGGFFSATLTLGGVLTGFMATLKAMLFSMPQSTFRRLKGSGYINELMCYLKEAISGGFILCIVSVVALYARTEWMHPLVAGTAAFVLAAVSRVARIGMSIMAMRE